MSLTDRQKDLLIAVALTEFSVHYEDADPKFAEHAWQPAASRLVDHDVRPADAVDALEIVNALEEKGVLRNEYQRQQVINVEPLKQLVDSASPHTGLELQFSVGEFGVLISPPMWLC